MRFRGGEKGRSGGGFLNCSNKIEKNKKGVNRKNEGAAACKWKLVGSLTLRGVLSHAT